MYKIMTVIFPHSDRHGGSGKIEIYGKMIDFDRCSVKGDARSWTWNPQTTLYCYT